MLDYKTSLIISLFIFYSTLSFWFFTYISLILTFLFVDPYFLFRSFFIFFIHSYFLSLLLVIFIPFSFNNTLENLIKTKHLLSYFVTTTAHYSQCPCNVTNTALCDPVTGNCTCNHGWTGATCDEDIDECLTSPCSGPNARCMNTLGTYTCLCVDGYYLNASNLCQGKKLCNETTLRDWFC